MKVSKTRKQLVIPCGGCGTLNRIYPCTTAGYPVWIGECRKCKGIIGEIRRYSDAGIVPEWDDDNANPEELRYFDLVIDDGRSRRRVHGWFNIYTRRIAQTG